MTDSTELTLEEQTAIVRSVDEEFRSFGGSTRHWIMLLNSRGYRIAKESA